MNRRFLSFGIGAILFALAIYRATTQSITIDEAQTYNEYVRRGWNDIFNGWFDANNHVLYSSLERISITLFGLSELTMRLPALAGAALLLWSLARICARVIEGTAFCILAFLVVAGNPLTLDFMAAARGYGLALGLFSCGICELVEWQRDGRDWRIPLASFLSGLAIGANLIFVFATAGAMAAAAIWMVPRWKLSLLAKLILPCASVALALWWLPFRNYESDRFYFGTDTLMASLESIEWVLFLHNPDRGDPFGNWHVLHFFRETVVPVAAVFLGLALVFKSDLPRNLRFVILTFFGTCGALWLAHTFLHIKYPEERTGLAAVFLFFLAWMSTMAHLWKTTVTRWLFAGPSLGIALILLAQFAGQFDARYFGTWRGDWKMNELMSRLKSRHGTLRSHWVNRPVAECYRDMYKLDFPEIPRHQGDKLELKGADYYIVPAVMDDEIKAAHLRIVYRDTASGVTLLGPEL